MNIEINGLYRFGGFELDPANRAVTGDGKLIAIPSRAFDLLLFMVANSQRLLTKEELMQAVWGDTAVEESNLTQSVFLLRKALPASQTADNRLIVTVPGRGYRFTALVETIVRPGPEPGASDQSAAAPRRPARKPWLTQSLPANRWWIAGAAATVAAAALILLAGSWRRPGNRPIPMPHQVTTNSAENPVGFVAISPDGRYLAYASTQSITIETLRSAETRTISMASGVSPSRVAWYPDGTQLLIGERIDGSPRIMLFSVLSGKLSLLREQAFAPAISPDGNRILYVDGTYRELWLMDGNGENPRRILTAAAPDKLYPMFWSPDGMREWFVRVHHDKDQETITLETCDLNGARRTVALSDHRARAFRLLPAGRLIYAVEEGPQKYTNLWELPVDPAEGKAEGPARKLTNWTNFNTSGISSTADGKHIAFLNGTFQADVYVGDLRAGGGELVNTRRLTLDESDDWPSFWTPDDQAVVFESNRNGRSQIFRQRLDQTLPELLSMDAEEDRYPVFGGPWIYFHSAPSGLPVSWNKPMEIRRIPANGGASSEVLKDVGIDVACAFERPDICALVRLTNKTLAFYHFDHARGAGAEIGRMEYDSRLAPSFAVSPDGSEIGVLDSRGTGNRIRRIPLRGGAYSEVEVRGRKALEDLFWAADGKGWFLSSVTPANGEYLLHVNLQGESQVLYEQPQDGRTTWGIPTHDGKHLAFLRWTAPKNVWMIDGF